MWTAGTIRAAREHRARMSGRVALVATLGALHEGHLSLIDTAKRIGDHVLVSIFVNPLQFGPGEDYERYPRPLEEDLSVCRGAGVEGVLCPDVDQIYPPGQIESAVTVPQLATVLEGEFRPHHFAGVCRVVVKLLNILQPQVTCFGQKDFQQMRIVEAIVRDLNIPVEVVECPTVREPDGLAASTRNQYLSGPVRSHALGLYKSLLQAKLLIEKDGETNPRAVEQSMAQVMQTHQVSIDYAVVRHPASLAEIDCVEPHVTGGVVALVAGRVGEVRLIDNMVIAGPSGGTEANGTPVD